MKSLKKAKEIKDKFNSLLREPNEQEGVFHDALILMSGYLSEIDKYQNQTNTTRKWLAEKIKISASYLTQVFRGNKPLNFITIAKMQRALDLRFEVKAYPKYGFLEETKVETGIIQININVNYFINYESDNKNYSYSEDKFIAQSTLDTGSMQVIEHSLLGLN